MKKENYILAFICLSGLLLFGSCSGIKNHTKQTNTDKIFNGEWMVTRINNNAITDHIPTMVFNLEEKRVAGKTGCNSYFADFEINKGAITFERAATTKMLCIESMDVEDAFLDAFNQITNYTIEKQNIQFLNKEGKTVLEIRKK